MNQPRHLLVNGLSVGSGGGYTVARGIARHLGVVRPRWRVTLLLTEGVPLHEQMRSEWFPPNVALHFAPKVTRGRFARARYERQDLPRWVVENGVSAVVQLNGIVVPTLPVPTVAHFQDPWPYRSQAWTRPQDRLLAAAKRFAFARSIRRASWCGFTSDYLRDVILGSDESLRERSSVFFNGLPKDFVARLEEPLDDWSARPLKLLTVSDVTNYKRQWLVVRALAELRRRPGLEALTYQIIGRCEEGDRRQLTSLARELGVEDAVHIEGRVANEDVRKAFGSSRAFVLMSVCESFGVPAIEAMSCGTPVVAARCCAVPEVCGNAAELVPVDDLDALVESIATVLLDPSHAKRLRDRGRARVRRFDWHDTAERIAKAVQEVTPLGGMEPLPRRRGLVATLIAIACAGAIALI